MADNNTNDSSQNSEEDVKSLELKAEEFINKKLLLETGKDIHINIKNEEFPFSY